MKQLINFPKVLAISFIILVSCNGEQTDLNQQKFKNGNPRFSSQFENQLKRIYQEKELFGDFIFAVVNENGLAYSFAWNRDIREGKISTLDNNSPIYIASHTKSFTGTLLKVLEEKGDLNLNNSLDTYLPELNYNDSIDTKAIEVRDLLNHTHGTFSTRFTWKTAFLGYSGEDSELIDDLNNDFLLDPSRKFRYSNVGPIIAGMIVNKTTGNSWKSEMRDRIFLPLEMDHTSVNVTDFDFDKIRPAIVATKEQGIIESGFYKEDITMHASGGIISTIHDLSKWLSINIRQDAKLLSKNAWADLHNSTTTQDKDYFTYHRTGYSLGWDIAEYQKNTILTRFGGLAGISFHISFLPEKNIGIIAFSNDNRASLLPHLMANYAYNQLSSLPMDSIFKIEKEKFDNSFDKKNEKSYAPKTSVLKKTITNDNIQGVYQNSLGWPEISIVIKDNRYMLNWGILMGKIYKSENDSYLSRLGVVDRNFEIRSDTLFTGSLIYTKIND